MFLSIFNFLDKIDTKFNRITFHRKNPDKLTSQPKTTAKLQRREDDSKLDLKVNENEYWDVDDDSNGPNRFVLVF